MSRSRILACAFTCCPPGTQGFRGGEDVLGWNLIQQIAKSHEVWVLTNAEDRESLELATEGESTTNIHFHYVALPSRMKPLLKIQGGHQLYYYLWQAKAYFAARRLHKQLGFSLFHHITYANDWMASYIGAGLPVPYVRGPGGGAHRTPRALQREYNLGGRIWEKVRSAGQWIFRHDPFFIRGQQRASALLLCNNDSVAKIPKHWAHKVHLFPVGGVSSEDLAMHDKIDGNHPHFSILSAGSLIRVKGFGLSIRAFKEFSKNHADSRLNIVGGGPEESHIKDLVHMEGLDDKVNLWGSLPRDELISLMASQDVVLFPSLRDGGGTVVIEAMSVGKPVVCLDIGGPGMHIDDSCGIKVSPGPQKFTVHRLAEALERLYLDESLRVNMGEAGRERARRFYHWDRLGERLMDIYGPLIERESGK